MIGEIWMAVIPRNEICRGMATLQVFAGNTQIAVGGGAISEYHLVIMRLQIGQLKMLAIFHIAIKSHVGLFCAFGISSSYRLIFLVIRRDTCPDKTIRGR